MKVQGVDLIVPFVNSELGHKPAAVQAKVLHALQACARAADIRRRAAVAVQ